MPDVERGVAVHELWPLLDVCDINRSVAFYCNQLGFTLVAQDAGPGAQMSWCRLERGGASIMLQGPAEAEGVPSERRGKGVCLYFICDDAETMYGELVSRGVDVKPPKVAYYGMKQLYVPEPDGYAICFESPTRSA